MTPYRRRTKPVPPVAKIRPTGRNVGVAAWTDSMNRPREHPVELHGGGWWIVTERFYVRLKDDGGRWKEYCTGVADPVAAERWALERRKQSMDVRAGVTSRRAIAAHQFAGRPIADVITEYVADLATRSGVDHVRAVEHRLRRLARECRFATAADVTAGALNRWTKQRADAGDGFRNINTHLIAAQALMNWAVLSKYTDDKLTGVHRLNDAEDPRRPRRAFTPEEFHRFIDAVTAINPDRALIYRTAVQTGLRRAELGQIRGAQIRVGDLPELWMEARQTKNRKADRLPIPRGLADELRAAATDDGPIFRFTPRPRTFDKDLARAGIPKRDDHGRTLDFHSLRKSFVTWLLMGGASVPVVMRLARHADPRLTLGAYNDADQLPTRDAAAIVEKIVAPSVAHKFTQNGGFFVATINDRLSEPSGPADVNRLPAVLSEVGARGFEPPASCTPCKRGDAAEPLVLPGGVSDAEIVAPLVAKTGDVSDALKTMPKPDLIRLLADLIAGG